MRLPADGIGFSWVLMQPHSICIKRSDKLIDAFNLSLVGDGTHFLTVLLNLLVYFNA
jgi:hypothetical protein